MTEDPKGGGTLLCADECRAALAAPRTTWEIGCGATISPMRVRGRQKYRVLHHTIFNGRVIYLQNARSGNTAGIPDRSRCSGLVFSLCRGWASTFPCRRPGYKRGIGFAERRRPGRAIVAVQRDGDTVQIGENGRGRKLIGGVMRQSQRRGNKGGCDRLRLARVYSSALLL